MKSKLSDLSQDLQLASEEGMAGHPGVQISASPKGEILAAGAATAVVVNAADGASHLMEVAAPEWPGIALDTKIPRFHKAGRDFRVLNCEAAILSLLLNCPHKLTSLIADLTTEHFFYPHNRALFASILQVHNSTKPFTIKSVLQDLADTGDGSKANWTTYIDGMAAVQASLEDEDFFKRLLGQAVEVRGGDSFAVHHYNENLCAEMLHAHLGDVRCVADNWFAYDGSVWNRTTRDPFRPLARECIHPSQRQARRILDVLGNVESKLQVKESGFFSAYKTAADGRVLINAENGVIEFSPAVGIQFRPHHPDDGFLRKLAAAYDPAAVCPVFESVVLSALPDQADRALLQCFAGSVLYPTCQYEVSLVCFGEGATGKSTIAEGIRLVIGSTLCSSLDLDVLCDTSSYAVAELKHKMLNLGSELKGTEVTESSGFKKLVSGELLNVRQIYEAPEEMQTTVKLMFLSNHIPRFRGGTGAELRRIRILHFRNKPDVPDPRLKEKLKAEASGVLNWMLTGLANLVELDAMPDAGAASNKLLETFSKSNDPVGSFVQECCELRPDYEVGKEVLAAGFAEWCQLNGIVAKQEDSSSWFYKSLKNRFPYLKHIRRRTKVKVGKENPDRARFVVGIRLRSKQLLPKSISEEVEILMSLTGDRSRPINLPDRGP